MSHFFQQQLAKRRLAAISKSELVQKDSASWAKWREEHKSELKVSEADDSGDKTVTHNGEEIGVLRHNEEGEYAAVHTASGEREYTQTSPKSYDEALDHLAEHHAKHLDSIKKSEPVKKDSTSWENWKSEHGSANMAKHTALAKEHRKSAEATTGEVAEGHGEIASRHEMAADAIKRGDQADYDDKVSQVEEHQQRLKNAQNGKGYWDNSKKEKAAK
jgi:hypothetical protein